ncbi:protein-L-isoaspartate(D-aspartate) O-methyltransferase [Stella sp.]|uniref:protein-L-isoaspartate(D-aspartate) O-methyltransferase n=1 Tax=Stella sp. TaxID=2912054 RepID=UPI0035B43317
MELRRQGIGDTRVLGAMERIPRESFVPEMFRDQAYEDTALPIGHGQTISQPTVVARMTEALAVGDRHRVLEIGTGSGYQAAVLARLCRRLYTIERHRPLLQTAEARFRELRLHNVTTRWGDGTKGWPESAPFDRIIVTAAGLDIPDTLPEQLAPGGVMVIPVGERGDTQRLVRIVRADDGFVCDDMGTVRFVPLVAGLPRGAAGRTA